MYRPAEYIVATKHVRIQADINIGGNDKRHRFWKSLYLYDGYSKRLLTGYHYRSHIDSPST